jgi:hypothetical protein
MLPAGGKESPASNKGCQNVTTETEKQEDNHMLRNKNNGLQNSNQ